MGTVKYDNNKGAITLKVIMKALEEPKAGPD